MISASNLSFSYAPGQPALKDITLTLQPGERVLLLGANGAGKSTFLSLCNGLLRPCHGELLLDGDPFSYSAAGLKQLRAHVATLLQDPADQLFGATVLQDVAMGPYDRGAAEADARRVAMNSLESLGIARLAHRPIHALSLGEKKRAALAGVLAGNPAVLLLDEPTAGLDAPGEDALLELLAARTRQGLTVLLASHDTGLLLRWASRALVLRAGRLAYDGPLPNLLRQWSTLTAGCGLREPATALAEFPR